MRMLVRAAVVVTAAVLIPVVATAQQGRTRRLYITVSDQSNAPVLDLTPADFQIRENGAVRTVTRAVVNQPMRIALMVDNSDPSTPSLTPMRAGLQAFIDQIPAQHEIVLLTTGRQLRVRVPPTTDHKKLKDGVGIIFPDAGSPSVLLSGLSETFDRFFKSVPDRWAVFVIVTTDGPENSNMNPKQFDQLAATFEARDVLFHAITLSTRGYGMQADAAHSLVQNSGGHADSLLVGNALPEKLKALGAMIARDSELLSHQYQVDYSTDSPEGPNPIEVTIARAGLRSIVSPGKPMR